MIDPSFGTSSTAKDFLEEPCFSRTQPSYLDLERTVSFDRIAGHSMDLERLEAEVVDVASPIQSDCEPEEISGYPCYKCNTFFTSINSLEDHWKTHHTDCNYKHQCPECSYSTEIITDICKHMHIHSGEKVYTCPHCPRKFTQKSHLHSHLFQHTGEKRFSCNFCKKQFVEKRKFTRHLSKHTEKRFRCPDCSKSFSFKYDMKVHRKSHTQEKPYNCSYCESKFTSSGSLAKHIACRHTKVFPHTCTLCGLGYNTLKSLKRHSKKKHSKTGN
ncbi:Zinc finger protein Xfin [Araneus ventricosus]|uniref:Zinc finger protein Xfin n=1 Tax=Araneus ventricosus TaxID=182803 RepID=A0A4Y2KQ56_ARAVE|nr:Zinc finger protein Xfin [Araneus ventricosus]